MRLIACGNGATSMIYVYSTATLLRVANISMPAEAREVVFLRNGTVMMAAIRGTSTIAFYNVTSPISYTLTSTLSAPQLPYTLCRMNDTYLLMGGVTTSSPLQTLSYDTTSGNWTWGTLPATIANGSNYNFQSTIDPCGRLWLIVRGYGIRIYDSTGTQLLYSWPLSTGLNGIVVHNNFDVYVADYTNNRTYSYTPGIVQCTS
ncbi:unnamed protein product [Didymodactylos carnosus]|uniref:Uncharacterized protein n=1 Tax=Didymodactylos carnosus TaxID=1234261 RepID=A0A815X1B1_9BILA|nr:unnamed protein product [Didymodactylos carnosus]CAF4412839.1 unnamed protein product [Didymodactylos carnosus]